MKNNILSHFSVSSCSGCGVCINSCPTKALDYGEDENGFSVPVVDNNLCIECGLCEKRCPFDNKLSGNRPVKTYAAITNNHSILKNSSSGGLWGTMATCILNRSGGVVFGCTMDEKFQSKHIVIDNIKELPAILRSKYIQSYSGDIYKRVKEYLDNGRVVLFSGTPCMVAGLKSFLGKLAYSENLYTVDIVCHGISSQHFFNDYILTLSNNLKSPIKEYIFRYKRKKDNGMEWNVMYSTSKRGYVKNWPEDSYNYFYMMGLSFRDSCYKCPFSTSNRFSDITLCDYWGWEEEKLPFNADDSVSGVLINSNKGEILLSQIRDSLKLEESNLDSLSKHNGSLMHPFSLNEKGRKAILDIWHEKGYDELDKYFKRKNRIQILKYRIMRSLPKRIIKIVHQYL